MFKCDSSSCNAKCCKNLKGSTLINYDFDDKHLIHLLIKPNEISIGLFNWEKEELLKINPDLKIKPLRCVITREHKPIIIKWCLDYDTCPFLSNNKCLIYNKRPLTCRAFPLVHQLIGLNQVKISSLCPFNKEEPTNELISYYNKIIEANNKINNEVNELIKKNEIIKLKTSEAIRITKTFLQQPS